jgi:maltoporin
LNSVVTNIKLSQSGGSAATGTGAGVKILYQSANGAGYAGITMKNGVDSNNDTEIRFQTQQSAAGGLLDRMTILANGNVGIGTAAPQNLLHVNGTTQTTTLYATQQVATPSISANYISTSQPLNLGAGTASYLALSTNGEKVRIDNSGNVGIGTTAPTTKLHVQGAGNFVTFENTDTTANAYAQVGIKA